MSHYLPSVQIYAIELSFPGPAPVGFTSGGAACLQNEESSGSRLLMPPGGVRSLTRGSIDPVAGTILKPQ